MATALISEPWAPPTRRSSPQQSTIYDWVCSGRGNGMGIAVAGSGKSTTLAQSATYMKGSIAAVMYGAKASREFRSKLDEHGLGTSVRSGTAHSFGFNAWRYANKDRLIKLDEKEKWNMLFSLIQVPDSLRGFVKQLVSLAKQRAIGYLVPANDRTEWMAIIDHFGLQYELSDRHDQTSSENDPSIGFAIDEGIGYAQRALKQSIDLAREIIDYDDQIYMPLVANVRMWENNWLLIDEAQDTNPARRALYKKMLRPGGRALFVGDPHQAIFGFTGADNDALSIIKREFSCQELPLTVTFRCTKNIVAFAQQWVDHIQAHENNPEGVPVTSVKYADFLHQIQELRHQDAIICRNTKPLVELAFRLIRGGVPCHVEGKEIGLGLKVLAGKWRVTGLTAFTTRLQEWASKEVSKLMGKGQEENADRLNDRVETLLVIAQSLSSGSDMNDLRAKIDSMFDDTREGEGPKNLTLCTIHKSKGLEWDNVYLLGRNRYMPSPFARQEWQIEQEKNLCYVAATRAKSVLTEIEVPIT